MLYASETLLSFEKVSTTNFLLYYAISASSDLPQMGHAGLMFCSFFSGINKLLVI